MLAILCRKNGFKTGLAILHNAHNDLTSGREVFGKLVVEFRSERKSTHPPFFVA